MHLERTMLLGAPKLLKYLSKPSTIAIAFLLVAAITCSFAYLQYFFSSLENGEWEHIRGFTRIIVPDTFIYLAQCPDELSFVSIALLSVKNSIVPVIFWAIADKNWFVVFAMNWMFVLLTLVYMQKLSKILGISDKYSARMMALFVALPVVWYYSIGALKEIPTALCILAFIYHGIRRQYILTLFMLSTASLLRYQLLVPLLLYSVLFFRANPPRFRSVLIALFLVFSLFPLIKANQVFSISAAEFYRSQAEDVGTIGGIVERFRDGYIILSSFAIFFRALQSFFEPLLTFLNHARDLIESDFDIYLYVQLFTLILILPHVFRFIVYVMRGAMNSGKLDKPSSALLSFLVIYISLVGGTSFIHHRYLFPIIPLVLVFSFAQKIRLQPRYSTKAAS